VGYWALSIFSLWQFLLYFREHKASNLLAFAIGLLFAASFRPEALAYLLITPFALFMDNTLDHAQRRRYFLQAISVALGFILFAVLTLAMLNFSVTAVLSDFLSVYEPFLNSTFSLNEADSNALSTAVFGEYAASYSGPYITLFLITGLLAILIVKLFAGIGGPYFWLLVYGGYTRSIKIKRNLFLPIAFFLLTNAAIVFLFILITRFMSSRYAMLFCLLVVTLIPLVLASIVERIQNSNFSNTGIRVLILFFGYCAFDSFISFGQPKTFVFDSVEWIAAQPNEQAGLLTNNHAVAYYSGRVEDYDQVLRFITEQEIENARPNDLIAIEMHFEMSELVENASIRPLLEFQTAFPSVEDQQLAIYKRVDP